MLTHHHRFHGHGSLRYLYQNGDAVRSRVMTVKYITNPRRKHSRFAVVISKKVLKSAVRRNRVRRRVYEVIRAELPVLKDNHDVAIIIVFHCSVCFIHNYNRGGIRLWKSLPLFSVSLP